MKLIFYPISIVVGLLVSIREFFYDQGILQSYKVKTKIISVGNLTFGGAGKTPIVDFLVNELKKTKKIAVLSRGYGRKTKGFMEVHANFGSANPMKNTEKYGDEPLLIKTKHPDVRVFVGEDRVAASREIEKLEEFDLIIADDCFQHRRLRRDIDIVVVDSTEKILNYQYPPVGRARNSFSYLKRAHFVFLTKTNLCTYEQLEKIKNKLSNQFLIEFQSVIESFYDLKSGASIMTPLREVNLISGIAKPKSFEKLVSQAIPGVTIHEHFEYNDHHHYTANDLQKIGSKVGAAGILLTTEKDAVKLKEINKDLHIGVAKLVFENKTSLERLYEVLH